MISVRFLATGLLLVTAAAAGDPTSGIRSIEVRLFYHHSGTLSEPLTGKEALWNTIIGGGDAKEPSEATLVTVAVAGERGSFDPKAKVTLVVKNADSGRVRSRSSRSVGVLSTTGGYIVPFLLTDTGCEPLLLTATLSGAAGEQTTTVPFECGE